MKTKIIGILVCMLLIATALPAVGIINSKAQPEMLQGVLDQSQERSDECIWVGKNLLHVEVKIKQGYESSPDLIMYIEDSLGSPLVSLNMKATDIPDVCDWVIFDIDDVELVPGDTYIIHLKYDPGGEYAWCEENMPGVVQMVTHILQVIQILVLNGIGVSEPMSINQKHP